MTTSTGDAITEVSSVWRAYKDGSNELTTLLSNDQYESVYTNEATNTFCLLTGNANPAMIVGKEEDLLSPCPFCGGQEGPISGKYYRYCDSCHSVGPVAETALAAANRWEERADVQVSQDTGNASCPFCGGIDTLVVRDDADDGKFVTDCGACGAGGPVAPDEESVLLAWDTRAGDL